MSKFDECSKYVEAYLNEHSEEAPTVKIDDNVRYLMAQQYMEGYNKGQSDAMLLLLKR